MTDQEIQEGNKLVAEFITAEPEVLQRDILKAGTIESMHYHDDCNWLMPVVEKIFTVKNVFCGEITKVRLALFPVNIDSLYEAVIEFIKWYNRQEK